MMVRAHQFKVGDCVRTLRPIGRLPIGSIGTIHRVFGTGGMISVMFADHHAPLLLYYDRIEALPPQHQVPR